MSCNKDSREFHQKIIEEAEIEKAKLKGLKPSLFKFQPSLETGGSMVENATENSELADTSDTEEVSLN